MYSFVKNGGGGPPSRTAEPREAELFVLFVEKTGRGVPPPIYQHARCGSPIRPAVQAAKKHVRACSAKQKHARERVRRKRNRAICGRAIDGSAARRPMLVLVNGNNSSRHARKCKADSAVVDGNIFAVDFPRLSGEWR